MLNVNKLSFSFDDGEKVVSNLSLTAGKGERICLSAP